MKGKPTVVGDDAFIIEDSIESNNGLVVRVIEEYGPDRVVTCSSSVMGYCANCRIIHPTEPKTPILIPDDNLYPIRPEPAPETTEEDTTMEAEA